MAEKEQEQQHKIQRKTTNSFIASMVLGMFFTCFAISYCILLSLLLHRRLFCYLRQAQLPLG